MDIRLKIFIIIVFSLILNTALYGIHEGLPSLLSTALCSILIYNKVRELE